MTSKKDTAIKPKKTILKKGLIVFGVSFLFNLVFVGFNVHGLVRELARLGVLAGMVMMIFRGIQNLFGKNKDQAKNQGK